MRIRSMLLLVVLALPVTSFAQGRGGYGHGGHKPEAYTQSGSALSVFSETGEQFFLMINGIKQNTYPQSRVRVEGLPQVTNDIQVIFNDNRTQAIQKRITFANPVDERAINLVLKIERDNFGPYLAFQRSSPVMRDYRPEQGEFVMSYCNNTRQVVNTPPPPPPPPAGPVAMDPRSFADAKRSISGSSFESTKLSTAKTVLSNNFVTTDQVIEICKLFSFDDTKLEFAKYAYNKTVDNNNYFKVGNVFSFSSSRESLNQFISGGR